jgi:RNA polymerase sigma-70 factor (ECF subfamily)
MMLAVDVLPVLEMAPKPLAPEATVELLNQARNGDASALERLLERCMPPLTRWAHGRLPGPLRGPQETADLVQNAIKATLDRLDKFEVRHQGALQAYLRTAVLNQIRDLARQQQRRGPVTELPETLANHDPSPLEQAIGAENLSRYEAAVERLPKADQEAIIGRIELQYTYDELAVVLGKPTPDAARMAVTRALKRLATEMRNGR